MNQKPFKIYNKIIAFLLSILGIGGACTLGGCEYGTPAVEYGTPYATFKITGNVTSEDNTKIQNIRVVLSSDTAYTDENGDYVVQTSSFPDDQDFLVGFKDVDGNLNGNFQSKDTLVSFKNPQFVNGDGWNNGETSKEINIKLEEDN